MNDLEKTPCFPCRRFMTQMDYIKMRLVAFCALEKQECPDRKCKDFERDPGSDDFIDENSG